MQSFYFSLCLLGGWLLGMVVAIVRQWTHAQSQQFQPDWILGGVIGAAAYLALGWLLRLAYRRLTGALGAEGIMQGLVVLALGAITGALVAAPLSLLLVIFDPHEVLVAMLDFDGVLLGIGALLGSVIGSFVAVRAHLAVSPSGLGAALAALGVGLVLGLMVAWGVTLLWAQAGASA